MFANMQQVTFAEFRNKAGHWLDQLEAGSTPIRITRSGQKPTVLLRKRDYDRMMEALKR